MQGRCPTSGGDNNLSPLDLGSATRFDNRYFTNVEAKRGLLHSDQQLFSGGDTSIASIVQSYAANPATFFNDFQRAMINMGNIKPLTGTNGQIRTKQLIAADGDSSAHSTLLYLLRCIPFQKIYYKIRADNSTPWGCILFQKIHKIPATMVGIICNIRGYPAAVAKGCDQIYMLHILSNTASCTLFKFIYLCAFSFSFSF